MGQRLRWALSLSGLLFVWLSNDTASLIYLLQSLLLIGTEKHTRTRLHTHTSTQKPRAVAVSHNWPEFFSWWILKHDDLYSNNIWRLYSKTVDLCWNLFTALTNGSESHLRPLTTLPSHKNDSKKKAVGGTVIIAAVQSPNWFNSEHSVRVYKTTVKHNGWYRCIMAIPKKVIKLNDFIPADHHCNFSHYFNELYPSVAHRFLNRAFRQCCLLGLLVQLEACKEQKRMHMSI